MHIPSLTLSLSITLSLFSSALAEMDHIEPPDLSEFDPERVKEVDAMATKMAHRILEPFMDEESRKRVFVDDFEEKYATNDLIYVIRGFLFEFAFAIILTTNHDQLW